MRPAAGYRNTNTRLNTTSDQVRYRYREPRCCCLWTAVVKCSYSPRKIPDQLETYKLVQLHLLLPAETSRDTSVVTVFVPGSFWRNRKSLLGFKRSPQNPQIPSRVELARKTQQLLLLLLLTFFQDGGERRGTAPCRTDGRTAPTVRHVLLFVFNL